VIDSQPKHAIPNCVLSPSELKRWVVQTGDNDSAFLSNYFGLDTEGRCHLQLHETLWKSHRLEKLVDCDRLWLFAWFEEHEGYVRRWTVSCGVLVLLARCSRCICAGGATSVQTTTTATATTTTTTATTTIVCPATLTFRRCLDVMLTPSECDS